MVYWLFAALLVLGTVAVLIRAGMAATGGSDSADASLNIYKDQLAELERDVAQGLVSVEDASAQKIEIQRRLLQAAREKPSAKSAALKHVPWFASLVVPVLAAGLYWHVGSPQLADLPRAERMANAIANGDAPAMIAQVEEHLEKRPDDLQGWQILLGQYTGMGRHADAARALQNVMRLVPPTGAQYADLAELLTLANQGLMTAEAVSAAREAFSREPQNPKAMYYAAIALKEDGKKAEALGLFKSMRAAAPSDAPWLQAVTREIAALEVPSASATSAAPEIAQEQIEEGMGLSPEERQEMIRGMVEGLESKLEANANDLQGWLRLIRARAVMGEREKAEAALTKARSIFVADAAATQALADVAKQMGMP